jgi:hypothetical protein
MQFHFDDDFLEGCVFVCTSGRRKSIAPLAVARFNHQREKLYRTADPDERNAGFFRLHLTWFREWGLEDFLAGIVGEYPELPRALMLLAFRKARGKQDEAAELYVNPETGRHGIVAFRCEQFADDAALARFLRHEFTHLHDMVAPAFGYAPRIEVPGITATQHRLARERYRLLWDITIDSRLARAGHDVNTTREQYRARFDGAYAFWPEARRCEVLESLRNDPHPTHAKLVTLAADPRDLAHAAGPQPGAACPLCGFPTFHWAALEQFAPVMIEHITSEFPTWTPHQSACLRCHETYEALAKNYDYLTAGV